MMAVIPLSVAANLTPFGAQACSPLPIWGAISHQSA
jgi:hypothetical protein